MRLANGAVPCENTPMRGLERAPRARSTADDLMTDTSADPAATSLSPHHPEELSLGGQLAHALAAIIAKVEKAAADPDPVTMIHDARKAMKEYRALLRLIPTDGAKAARRETARVARTLSEARDRTAARDAIAALTKASLITHSDGEAAERAIGTDMPADGDDEAHRQALHGFVSDAHMRLLSGLSEQAAQANVEAGLVKSYRVAAKGAFTDPLALHETRKRVVTHRYQMSFLASSSLHEGTKRATRAQEVRDLLGTIQDAETLRRLLDANGSALDVDVRTRVAAAVDTFQRRTRKKALRRHNALFRRRARKFAHRFGLD